MESHRREDALSRNNQPSNRRDAIPRGEYVPKGTGFIHKYSDGSLMLENLTHKVNSKDLEAAVVTIKPRASWGETEIYLGEKWIYILEGKMEILVNNASYILSEGDSIYLESTAAHTWRNSYDRRTKALVFSSPYPLSV